MNQRSIFMSGFHILVVALIFTFIQVPSIQAQEVEDEREFDYIKGSEKGPANWGELKKEWEVCKKGRLQSPIDLANYRVELVVHEADITRNYKPYYTILKNRGHDISLQWEGFKAGSITIEGTEYHLEQCHWHSPSEHTINGRRYDMELHMVHESQDQNTTNKIAVVGVLYKIGKPDAFLSKLIPNVMSMSNQELETKMGIIDPRKIRTKGKRYYRYMGSLTIPPCTEGVTWIINKKIKSVSRDQVKALRVAVHDYAEENSRPLQPHNLREIEFHSPDPEELSN